MSFSASSRTTLLIFFLGLFIIPAQLFAQSVSLKGKVTDTDGNPLQSASVNLKGSTTGTTTKTDGTFSLTIANRDSAVLVISSIGFAEKEVRVGASEELNIQLDRITQPLNDVVVVGYGTQRKRDVTGSVVSVPKERLQQLPNNNIYSAIQGSMPGVQVTMGTAGAEGNQQSILIRGRKSISASTSPLVIWDGIPYVGGISDINPNDVESIEVLKDASAAAIYGSRGSNGVILVTSKQGKKGKLSVTYDGSYSIQTLTNEPTLLTGPEFYWFKTTRKNANTNLLTPSEQKVYDSGKWVDWYDLATQTGSRSSHNLSVRGASDKASYYIGGSYLDVQGVSVNDDYKRYTLRPNLEIKLTPWLTFSSNSQLSFGDRSGEEVEFDDTRNTGGGANFFNPLSEPYNADGSIALYAYPDNTQSRNPLSNLLVKNSDVTYKVFTTNSFKVDFPFAKGLSYRLNTGVEYENNQRMTYYGRDVAAGYEVKGDAINFSSVDRNFTIENILNYTRDFGKHILGLTGLYSSQSNDYDRQQLEGVGFPNDVLTNYQMDQAALLTPSTANYKQNFLSQMIRANYGYDGRYLLTLTARRDGYSAFGEGKKYGIFPSAAVAWNIFQESFMQNVNFVSNLKLRASYGLNGNQAVAAYRSLARLSDANYLDGTTVLPGYIPSELSNDELGWESTRSLTIGVDFGLLKNRIQGSIDVYSANTYDLLLQRNISPVQGITKVWQNIGETSNKGIEIGITSTNISKRDLVWTTNANFAYNKNAVVDVYGDGKDDVGNKWFIGQPIRVAYGLQYDGIFRSQEEVANSAQPTDKPGYVRVKDIDGSKTISTDKDRVILGNLDPKYVFGLTNTVRYKNFSLMVFLQGVAGLVKANDLESDNVFADTRRNTTLKDWWDVDNPTGKHWANDANANKLGVAVYEKGDYFRLKDVSLAYNLPQSLLSKWKLANAKVYVSGRNLATATKYRGLDPELSNQFGLPLQRDLLFGLTIGL